MEHSEIVQGEVIGESFNDELNSAISNAAYSARGLDGIAGLVLASHLKKLCKMQRQYLSETNEFPLSLEPTESIDSVLARTFGLKKNGT